MRSAVKGAVFQCRLIDYFFMEDVHSRLFFSVKLTTQLCGCIALLTLVGISCLCPADSSLSWIDFGIIASFVRILALLGLVCKPSLPAVIHINDATYRTANSRGKAPCAGTLQFRWKTDTVRFKLYSRPVRLVAVSFWDDQSICRNNYKMKYIVMLSYCIKSN